MANNSIAGRAHGGKPSSPPEQTAEYRPQLTGVDGIHPEVARAMQIAFDNLYALRNQVQQLQPRQGKIAGPAADKPAGGDASGAGAGDTPNHATGILGINIKAATDPNSLQNGMTIRYNSSTGQFEFGT